MAGLRNICRAYGGMKVTGNNGTTINYVWDYVADEPMPDTEMPVGSRRSKASQRRKAELLVEKNSIAKPTP